MKQNIYYCKTFSEAQDAANIAYINMNAARGIYKDMTSRQISITNRNGAPLLVFQF